MKLPSNPLARKAPPVAVDGVTAEPTENQFKNYLLMASLALVPLLLFLLYRETKFVGLTNADALDYAQLGRNLASGRGFVTYILRPLALGNTTNPLRAPDVTHGPLYPLALAIAFGAGGAKDAVVAWVSGLFYLLTVPVVYRLGMRAFNRTVGFVAAAVFACNAVVLGYAVSGLPITLTLFLTTSLLLAIYNLAARHVALQMGQTPPFPKGRLVLTGVLAGALYLTDPQFFWVLPVIVGAVLWLNRVQRLQALVWFGVPLLLVAGPWMLRNALLTGNPVFGLRGMEVWMNTRSYPGFDAYRMLPGDLIPGAHLLREILKKMVLTVAQVLQSFPNTTTSWALAFFIPSLFLRFPNPAAMRMRAVLVFCFLGLFLGSLIFTLNLGLFLAFVPAMLVMAAALLVNLVQGMQLRAPSLAALVLLLAFMIIYPVVGDVVLVPKPQPVVQEASARALGGASRPDEVVLSDQPWLLAWYADRPSLWIPAKDEEIGAFRKKFAKARWLYLTQQVASYSLRWEAAFGLLRDWNVQYLRARNLEKQLEELKTRPDVQAQLPAIRKQIARAMSPAQISQRYINSLPPQLKPGLSPLYTQLLGFTTVPPMGDGAVIAVAPPPAERNSATPGARPDVAQQPSAGVPAR